MVSRATPTTATQWSPIEKVIQFTTLALFLVDKPKMVKRQRQVKSARIGNHDGGLGKSRKRRKKVKGMSEKEVACLHLHVLKYGRNEFSANHSTQDIINEVLILYKKPTYTTEILVFKQIFKVLLYVAANFDSVSCAAQHVNKCLLFLSALFLQYKLPFQQGKLCKMLLFATIVKHKNRFEEIFKHVVRTCLLVIYNEMKCLMISYDIENVGSRNQGCSCLYKN